MSCDSGAMHIVIKDAAGWTVIVDTARRVVITDAAGRVAETETVLIIDG